MMKIANGIAMLEISGEVLGRASSLYPALLWDEEAVVLVDTGFPGQLALFRAAMEQAGAPFERLTHILFTHQDMDHIGGARAMLEQSPSRVQVLAHETEKAFIQGDATPVKLARMEANLNALPEEARAMYEKMKAGFQNSYAPVDWALHDGEELPFAGGVTVIHTPGHTPGHICLYHRPSRTLIAGDALRVEDGRLVETPAGYTLDRTLSLQSLKKLAAFDVARVISYHGGLFADAPNQHIAALAETPA